MRTLPLRHRLHTIQDRGTQRDVGIRSPEESEGYASVVQELRSQHKHDNLINPCQPSTNSNLTHPGVR